MPQYCLRGVDKPLVLPLAVFGTEDALEERVGYGINPRFGTCTDPTAMGPCNLSPVHPYLHCPLKKT